MPERKLAHVEKVIDVQPIQNADKIEVCTVLGWKIVVKKGEVKPGDLVVFIEMDSQVPDIPYFEFMRERKFRVRTIKLRKQISQGLVIPLKNIYDVIAQIKPFHLFEDPRDTVIDDKEGTDITKLLGIKKYESPSDKESNWTPQQKKKYPWVVRYLTRYQWFRKMFHIKSKSFPSWISKTDEERLQNMPWILKNTDGDWYTSEKLDGQSATFWYVKKLFSHEFGICSRTVRKSKLDGSNWSRVAKQFDIENKIKQYCNFLDKNGVAIQGEIIGPKIQGGRYHNNPYSASKVTSPLDFYVFNVYFIEEKRYLSLDEIKAFCSFTGLKMVPILHENIKLYSSVDEMVEHSKCNSMLANILQEGVVWRKADQSISFKVINPEYLLKYE